MPKIQITQKDIDQAKLVDPGFYVVKLTSVEEKVNNKKDGTNYFFEFQVMTEGTNKDRYAKALVSNKSLGFGMVPIICALEQIDADAFEACDVDTDALIGKTCIVEIEHRIYEGREQVNFKNFFSTLANDIELGPS